MANKFPISAFNETFWTVIDGDWYVSTIGNDITGDGSPKLPFLTIHKAFELAAQGENIVIGPDEYLRVDGVGSNESAGTELPCRLASNSNINIGLSGLITIDDVPTVADDRVLIWKQDDPRTNGIYIASGNTWERASDFNNPENIIPGKLIPVLEGTNYGQSIFQFTTNETIVVGTTNLYFTQAAASDWGQIQGDIVDQRDLSVVLNAKVDVSQTNVPSADQIGIWGGDGSLGGSDQFVYDSIINQLNATRNSTIPPNVCDSIFHGDSHVISVGADHGACASIVFGKNQQITIGGKFKGSNVAGFNNNLTVTNNLSGTNVFGANNSLNSIDNAAFISILGAFNVVGDGTAEMFQTSILGSQGEASGPLTTIIGHNTTATNTIKRVALGSGSINAGSANTAQTPGHGTLGGASGIFGGVNGHVPSDSPRSVVVGGNSIKADSGSADTVFLPRVRIGKGTGAAIPNGSNENLLVLDGVSGEIKQIPQPPSVDVIDNLITMTTDQALSAGQGKFLKDLVDSKGSGDVTNDSSSADNAIAIFDGTSGKSIKASSVKIDNLGQLTGLNDINTGKLTVDSVLIDEEVVIVYPNSSPASNDNALLNWGRSVNTVAFDYPHARFQGSISDADRIGVEFGGYILNTNDVGNHPVTVFRSGVKDSTGQVSNRPLFSWYNRDTLVASIKASGDWNFRANILENIAELRLNSKTPSSSSDAGVEGTIARDSDFMYVCVATNSWKRVALSTW